MNLWDRGAFVAAEDTLVTSYNVKGAFWSKANSLCHNFTKLAQIFGSLNYFWGKREFDLLPAPFTSNKVCF